MIPYNPQAVMMVVMRREQSGGFLQSPTHCCTINPQPNCRDRRLCFSLPELYQTKPDFNTDA